MDYLNLDIFEQCLLTNGDPGFNHPGLNFKQWLIYEAPISMSGMSESHQMYLNDIYQLWIDKGHTRFWFGFYFILCSDDSEPMKQMPNTHIVLDVPKFRELKLNDIL